MKRYRILIFLSSCLILMCQAHISESASFTTTIDSKYVRTDKSEGSRRGLTNEYNPNIILEYSNALTEWTDLSAEGRLNYKKVDSKGDIFDYGYYTTDYGYYTTSSADTDTREPQLELRLKSSIYDLKTGFKETWNPNKTENRAFGYILVQPMVLPELRVNYDHDEKEDESKTDKFTLRSTYKPTNSLRIKFDLRHEYTDYIDIDSNTQTESPSVESLNWGGEIEFDKALSGRRPVKMELSYKFKSLFKESKETELFDNIILQDELNHILRAKLSYRFTEKTNLSLEYENKTVNDHHWKNDHNDQDLQFNLTHKITHWLIATGRIRKKNEKEALDIVKTANNTMDSEKKFTMQGQLKANLGHWFQLTFKAVDEQIEEFNVSDPNNLFEKKDKSIIEANLRSDFPNLLRSFQVIDYKHTDESKAEKPYTEEDRFTWRWNINPIENLVIQPEYKHSITDNISNMDKKTTNEFELSADYSIDINGYLNLNLSHKMSRKRIKKDSANSYDKSKITEVNDDSSLEIDIQPLKSLFINSQITRKDYSIEDERPSEEVAFSFKFDWSFTPFTWSTSYKYNDKRDDIDTETFESKIIYDISDYMIEGEYKFTQTFALEKVKEDVITLRLKFVF